MQKPKLTGWLIFFLTWMVIAGVKGLERIEKTDLIWRPHMANFPSLQGAVIGFQLLTGAGIAAWLYSAWVLYQRKPGTLNTARISLLVGTGLRIAGSWSVFLFGGLPKEAMRPEMPLLLLLTCVLLLFTGLWLSYLGSSKRVRQIYAE